MGFGSYDESEQERQEVDTDDINDEDGVKSGEEHEGDVEFEGMDDTESLLNRLNEIKGGEE